MRVFRDNSLWTLGIFPGAGLLMAEWPFKFGLHLLSTLRCFRIDWSKIPKVLYIR